MERLASVKETALVKLATQYRMHEDICYLCNLLVYKGALECANPSVAKSLLLLHGFPHQIPKPKSRLDSWHSNKQVEHASSWLEAVVDPTNVVIFGSTDDLYRSPQNRASSQNYQSSFESSNKHKTINTLEVGLVASCAQCFVACGLEPTDIGVICPYRAQVRS